MPRTRFFPISRAIPGGLRLGAIALTLGATVALAQDPIRPAPVSNGQKLSVLISKVEGRPGFHYVDEIEWTNGAYVVTYFTTDRAKVEIKLDPVTGELK